jgi:hypothetical protein
VDLAFWPYPARRNLAGEDGTPALPVNADLAQQPLPFTIGRNAPKQGWEDLYAGGHAGDVGKHE